MSKLHTCFVSSLAIILATCFVMNERAHAETDQVRLGYIPIGDCLTAYVAKDMGYFADEDISVEFIPMQSGNQIASAIESATADIGWSNTISVIMAHDAGSEYVFLTSGALNIEGIHNTHSLLVKKDSKIKSFSELSGKNIAINAKGTINELSLIAMADEHKVDISTIGIIEVPFVEMENELKKETVDAILAVEPFVTLSIMHDVSKILIRNIHSCYGERFLIASWFAKKEWVEKNPLISGAFIRAINRATEFIEKHPEIASHYLLNNTKLTKELLHQISVPAFSTRFDASDLQKMINVAYKYHFIRSTFSADELMHTEMDESYAPEEISLDDAKKVKSKFLNNEKLVLYLNFAFNSDSFTLESTEKLNSLGKILASKDLEKSNFLIEGHTDSKGNEEYNRTLSMKRALGVRDYLCSKFNLGKNLFRVIGKGESDPIPDLSTLDPFNRRVVIMRE